MPTLKELKLFAQYHLVRRVHDHPARDADLGVVSLGYEPASFEASIRAFADRFEVKCEGEATYRGVTRPIFSVASGHVSATKRLLVLSGVHGNEQAGILSVPPILERFDRQRERYRGVELHVVTPVNPIGAAELSRFNAEGYDINRDFVRFFTEEARIVKRTIEAMRPDFIVSLHEGPQDATFMFANEHVTRAMADTLLRAIEAGGTTLATHDYFGSRLRPPGLSPSSPAARAVLALWAGVLGMSAVAGYAGRIGVPELTLESGWRSTDAASRIRPHVDLVLALCDALSSA